MKTPAFLFLAIVVIALVLTIAALGLQRERVISSPAGEFSEGGLFCGCPRIPSSLISDPKILALTTCQVTIEGGCIGVCPLLAGLGQPSTETLKEYTRLYGPPIGTTTEILGGIAYPVYYFITRSSTPCE